MTSVSALSTRLKNENKQKAWKKSKYSAFDTDHMCVHLQPDATTYFERRFCSHSADKSGVNPSCNDIN